MRTEDCTDQDSEEGDRDIVSSEEGQTGAEDVELECLVAGGL